MYKRNNVISTADGDLDIYMQLPAAPFDYNMKRVILVHATIPGAVSCEVHFAIALRCRVYNNYTYCPLSRVASVVICA